MISGARGSADFCVQRFPFLRKHTFPGLENVRFHLQISTFSGGPSVSIEFPGGGGMSRPGAGASRNWPAVLLIHYDFPNANSKQSQLKK